MLQWKKKQDKEEVEKLNQVKMDEERMITEELGFKFEHKPKECVEKLKELGRV